MGEMGERSSCRRTGERGYASGHKIARPEGERGGAKDESEAGRLRFSGFDGVYLARRTDVCFGVSSRNSGVGVVLVSNAVPAMGVTTICESGAGGAGGARGPDGPDGLEDPAGVEQDVVGREEDSGKEDDERGDGKKMEWLLQLSSPPSPSSPSKLSLSCRPVEGEGDERPGNTGDNGVRGVLNRLLAADARPLFGVLLDPPRPYIV